MLFLPLVGHWYIMRVFTTFYAFFLPRVLKRFNVHYLFSRRLFTSTYERKNSQNAAVGES